MPKITFIKDHKVQQNDGKGPDYKAGETYDLHVSYAEKYKRLGYAVDAKDAPVVKPPPLFEMPTEVVEIPNDWRDLHWPQLKSLASKLTDQAVNNKPDAIAAIELEVERRAKQS